MTLTPPPTPPSRGDAPDVFSGRADALMGWLPTMTTELIALETHVNAKQAQVAADYAAAMAAGLADAAANAAAAGSSAAAAADSVVSATAEASAAVAARAAAETAAANATAVVTGGSGSLLPAPGKIPLAGASGRIDPGWLLQANDIGRPGAAGFGVGICPALPAGYTPLPGCTDVLSANYGNYQYSDGSIMCWIPAFWFRIGHAGNPTYAGFGANSIDIKPLAAFPDDATANAEGYWRHRAFVNAGANQPGFFRDKYDCSNNGGIASSIQNAMPLVSAAATGNSTFSTLTGAPANAYYGAIAAAKTRGAKFFPESIFIADALTRLSEAHAQASTGTTYCAWYDAAGVTNYPKGNNNNALKDGNDLSVTFTGAGATGTPNLALAGSGAPFAKTTHNGQACGVADVNGNIYKINPGMTCIAATKTITGATQTNPVALTIAGHGYATGAVVMITGAVGMTQLNDKLYTATVVDANTITLNGVDGTGFTAYTSGGSCTTGTFYALKPSVDIAAVTAGTTLATDHWGATGVAAQFDAITLNFATTHPSNGFAQRFGNAANAVFDMSTAPGRALAMLGMPAANGVSAAGTNLMGTDYYYQYIRNELCVFSRGSWGSGSTAGVRLRNLAYARTYATDTVGLSAASYL